MKKATDEIDAELNNCNMDMKELQKLALTERDEADKGSLSLSRN